MYICILCCATNLFNGVNQLVNVTKVTPKKIASKCSSEVQQRRQSTDTFQ